MGSVNSWKWVTEIEVWVCVCVWKNQNPKKYWGIAIDVFEDAGDFFCVYVYVVLQK